jgi:hypothetical protein
MTGSLANRGEQRNGGAKTTAAGEVDLLASNFHGPCWHSNRRPAGSTEVRMRGGQATESSRADAPLAIWLGLAAVAALLLGLWSPWPPASATLLAWPWVALLGFVVGRVTMQPPPAREPRPPVHSWGIDDEVYGDPDV